MEWEPAKGYGEGSTPQSEKISPKQELDSVGGFVWQVDDAIRLQRFLCIGSDKGTYYVGEKELTRQNAACVDRMIQQGKGKDAVDIIKNISVSGRAAKQNPTLFALSLCARSNDADTKKAAYEVLSAVCRIPTHLFIFIEYCQAQSAGTGWGRAHRRAITKWYNNYSEDPLKLALHVTKYRSRNEWTHTDVLRLAHIRPITPVVGLVLRYVIKGLQDARRMYLAPEDGTSIDKYAEHLEQLKKVEYYLSVVEEVRHSGDEDRVAALILAHRLAREHVPTPLLKSLKVWQALLKEMPMTALIRNLGKLTSIGLLDSGSNYENVQLVVQQLNNEKLLQKGRIHPFTILLALYQYKQGKGEKGKLTWSPDSAIQQALDIAFYMCFKNVEPTGKRYLLALDVSGSMCSPVMGSSAITARDASAAMMMVTARTEKVYEVVGFSHNLITLNIRSTDKLSAVVNKISSLPFGGTDCALPMLWSMEKKKKFDVFVVYTDCETYFGRVHPSESLKQYRKKMEVPDARLIVVGMTSNGFTIADPDDPGMLDVVGFDSDAPSAMSNFVLGKF